MPISVPGYDFYHPARGEASKYAFTLVELSIVLVIIGLIVGGIIVGRDLIQAAKLRSVLTDIEQFNASTLTFRNKYNCLPGDCPNAQDFFGTFASCGAYSTDEPNLSNSTCNGNGNGRVVLGEYTYWQLGESVLFWHHLSRAGLIGGNYTGIMYWGDFIRPGVNAPLSTFENGCYSINSSFTGGDSQSLPYTSMKGNFLSLGNSVAGEGGSEIHTCTESLASLPAIFAQNIDSKIDDGKPFTGNVQTTTSRYNSNWNYSGEMVPQAYPGCTNIGGGGGTYSTSIYAASAPVSGCQLFFKAAF